MRPQSNYNDVLDAYELFKRLPDKAHVAWFCALTELKDSRCRASGERRYRFCCGYAQALQDSGVLDGHLSRFMLAQADQVWADTMATLKEESP